MEVQGANDRIQLAELERHYQYRAARRLMTQGVTLRDPARFDVRGEVTVGRDVLIDVNVILEGKVVIEDNVQIGPNCVIKQRTLRRGAIIKANSPPGRRRAGRGRRLRTVRPPAPRHACWASKAHVGNFVELKNAVLGEGAKAGHLSYLGDAEIGARTNIGAGTITCNYDGANKFKTVIGEDVFIGSNSSLVAPADPRRRRHHRRRLDHHPGRAGRQPGGRARQAAQHRRLEAAGKDQKIIHRAATAPILMSGAEPLTSTRAACF